MADQNQLPYEQEARLFSDIVEFFTDRLPHAIGQTGELLDEAALSNELFVELSTRTDEDLARSGIGRDELSRVAAAASGLFLVANNRKKH